MSGICHFRGFRKLLTQTSTSSPKHNWRSGRAQGCTGKSVNTWIGFCECDSVKNELAASELLRYGITFSKLFSPPCLLLADKDSPPSFQHGSACHHGGVRRRKKQAQPGEMITASQCQQNSLQIFSLCIIKASELDCK